MPSARARPAALHLHAADVALRRLVLGVDGERERFDGRQMQVGDLRDVPC